MNNAAGTAGWFEWKGGICPVPSGTIVDVRHRDGGTSMAQQAWGSNDYLEVKNTVDIDPFSYASHAFWRHDGADGDIVAYRIAKQAEQAAEVQA